MKALNYVTNIQILIIFQQFCCKKKKFDALQPVVYMQNIFVNMNKNHTFLLDKDKKLEDKKREFAVTTVTMNW